MSDFSLSSVSTALLSMYVNVLSLLDGDGISIRDAGDDEIKVWEPELEHLLFIFNFWTFDKVRSIIVQVFHPRRCFLFTQCICQFWFSNFQANFLNLASLEPLRYNCLLVSDKISLALAFITFGYFHEMLAIYIFCIEYFFIYMMNDLLYIRIIHFRCIRNIELCAINGIQNDIIRNI